MDYYIFVFNFCGTEPSLITMQKFCTHSACFLHKRTAGNGSTFTFCSDKFTKQIRGKKSLVILGKRFR